MPVTIMSQEDRLDGLETNWAMIREACRETTLHAAPARAALVIRYLPAISSYVTAIVRNDDLGQDLTQDVCARLMKGDFSTVDEQRGRFRDYLKTAVRNVARSHWRREKVRATETLPEALTSRNSEDEQRWVAAWRTTVLEMTWRAMEAWERNTDGAIGATLLRIRAEHPDAPIAHIGTQLNNASKTSLSANAVRAQLHRARTKFAQFLVTEVARTLQEPTPDKVQEELGALGLLSYLPTESENPGG